MSNGLGKKGFNLDSKNKPNVTVILPAYNAEKTLKRTYNEIPFEVVNKVILVDDASDDNTVQVANDLNLELIEHDINKGYGGNQKTCYDAALDGDADIIVMLHPDYQYPPSLIMPMVQMILSGDYEVVLGSRILGGKSIEGGMPLYKYFGNRLLTFIQNLLIGAKLSEYHTGFRAYKREVLEKIPYNDNSDDFIFDGQVLSQIIYNGFSVGELSCPTRYFEEAHPELLQKGAGRLKLETYRKSVPPQGFPFGAGCWI